MTFANPVFLWSLLSLIPLAAIYLLKVRPTRNPTTAMFLWEDIFQEKRSTALFQRLRDLLSLLLMTVVFLALVCAVARPVWNADQQQDLVLVIDNTASMNAVDGLLRSRLDAAKSAATEIVESLGASQRCSIATVSDRVRYVSNLTDNPRDLLDAIAAIGPSDVPLQRGALSEFKRAEKSDFDSPVDDQKAGKGATANPYRAILISDGLVGEIPASMELIRVGDDTRGNIGIVASDLQRLPGKDRASIFVQLASSFERPVETEITISVGDSDNIFKLIPVTVTPGINRAVVFELDNAQTGRWFVSVGIKDALDSDNQSFLVLHPVKPIPVRVAADEKFFFENSVLAFSQSGGLLRLVTDGGQMLISQGNNEQENDPPRHLLIFRPQGKSKWWDQCGEEIEVRLPRATDDDHPVIRHIDVTTIPFVGARRVTVPAAAEVLVKAEDDTPLIWRMSQSGQSAVVVNLDPLDSNFYLSAWFPVLVYSSATHMAGRSEELRSTWQTGQIALLPSSDQSETTLTLPDGTIITAANAKTPLLRETGFYKLDNDSGTWQAACSLLSRQESMIDNRDVSGNIQPLNRGWSPVTWLTVFAIVVVTTESLLYQRRKVG